MNSDHAADLLLYTRKKVGDLFAAFPVSGHGLDHAERVAKWIVQIAKAEKCDPVLAELAALVHDTGRVQEFQNNPEKLCHHKLSHFVVKRWFLEDRHFDILSAREKDELLYAVRNHWDDAAEEYPLGNILRDADKLDMYGEIGLQRAIEFHRAVSEPIAENIKKNLECASRIKTNIAKRMIEDGNLLEPLTQWLQKYGY